MMKNVSLYWDGEIVQHVEYVPFGEVFIEERNNTWNTPYLFNAKELDEETGLYYYGARYYDARSSVWLSADPLQEKYPNVSTYVYCVQNPVRFVDPTGMDEWEINEKGEFVNRIENKNKTGFYIVDSEGNRMESKFVEFEYTTVVHTKGTIGDTEQTYESYTMFGDENGTKVFEFLAQNIGVSKEYGGVAATSVDTREFSLNRFGKESNTGINVVSTSFEQSSEASGVRIVIPQYNEMGFRLRESIHSHPYGGIFYANFEPSGLPGSDYYRKGRGDIHSARGIVGVNKSLSPISPKFRVYSGYFKKYIDYNIKGLVK